MQNQDNLLQLARNHFQQTGFCAHSQEFRTIVKGFGVKRETCKVCAKEFSRDFT